MDEREMADLAKGHGYLHVTMPRTKRETIGIIGGTPGRRRVCIFNVWHDANDLLRKGYIFSRPIGLTPALQNALQVICLLGMSNETLLSAIDGDGSLKRSLDTIHKVLTENGVNVK